MAPVTLSFLKFDDKPHSSDNSGTLDNNRSTTDDTAMDALVPNQPDSLDDYIENITDNESLELVSNFQSLRAKYDQAAGSNVVRNQMLQCFQRLAEHDEGLARHIFDTYLRDKY